MNLIERAVTLSQHINSAYVIIRKIYQHLLSSCLVPNDIIGRWVPALTPLNPNLLLVFQNFEVEFSFWAEEGVF